MFLYFLLVVSEYVIDIHYKLFKESFKFELVKVWDPVKIHWISVKIQ